MPITIHYEDESYKCTTFDISRTGMFIKTDDLYRVFKIENNKEIELLLKIGKNPIKIKAQVVRKSIAKGNYPAGVGIHFIKRPNDDNEWDTQYYNKVA